MASAPKQLPQQVRKTGLVELVPGDGNHSGMQGLRLGICTDAVQFQKRQRGSHGSPLVAVQTCLSFCNVKCVGGGHPEEIRVTIPKVMGGLDNRRLKPAAVTNPFSTAMLIKGNPVEQGDLVNGEECRLVHGSGSLRQPAQKFLVGGKHFVHNPLKSIADTALLRALTGGVDAPLPLRGGQGTSFLIRRHAELFDFFRGGGAHAANLVA